MRSRFHLLMVYLASYLLTVRVVYVYGKKIVFYNYYEGEHVCTNKNILLDGPMQMDGCLTTSSTRSVFYNCTNDQFLSFNESKSCALNTPYTVTTLTECYDNPTASYASQQTCGDVPEDELILMYAGTSCLNSTMANQTFPSTVFAFRVNKCSAWSLNPSGSVKLDVIGSNRLIVFNIYNNRDCSGSAVTSTSANLDKCEPSTFTGSFATTPTTFLSFTAAVQGTPIAIENSTSSPTSSPTKRSQTVALNINRALATSTLSFVVLITLLQ
jgi:hypothetical protein